MHNNYFSYSSSRKNNIVLVSFSVIIFIFILLVAGLALFAQRWEDARLNTGGEYADIPMLDKNGLGYFVEIKNQNIKDATPIPVQEDVKPVSGSGNI